MSLVSGESLPKVGYRLLRSLHAPKLAQKELSALERKRRRIAKDISRHAALLGRLLSLGAEASRTAHAHLLEARTIRADESGRLIQPIGETG